MQVTNLQTIPGKTIVEHFGLVSGSTVRAKHVGKDIMASFKTWWEGNSRVTPTF